MSEVWREKFQTFKISWEPLEPHQKYNPRSKRKFLTPIANTFLRFLMAPSPQDGGGGACHVKKNDNFCQNRCFTIFSEVLEFLPVFSLHAILIQIGYQLKHWRYTQKTWRKIRKKCVHMKYQSNLNYKKKKG